MDAEAISMVQECVENYSATDRPDGGVEIFLRIPPRFKDLWLVRLSELRTTEQEIRDYEGHPRHR